MTTGRNKRRFRVAEPKQRSRRQKILRFVMWSVFTMAAAGTTIGAAVYAYYAPTVPHFSSIDDYQPPVGARIYSSDNQLIGEFAAERRVLVPNERIPPKMFEAFIAAEDKRFYSHFGVDLIGVAQAIFDKIRNPGSKLRGASTISQQVAKSILATRESYEEATARKLSRKIREAILARRLESVLEKEEILYIYATQVFLGHKAYGVQAAAEHYFRKNVWELSLAEVATIAGLPQRPSDYSPFSRPEAARSRRGYVLGRMLAEQFITQEEYDEAMAEEISVYPRRELYLQIAPYYTEQVRREIVDRYGERALLEDGLQIYTALDIENQKIAQTAIERGLLALDKRQGYRGPLANLKGDKLTVFGIKYREYLGLEGDAELEPKTGQIYLGVVTGHEKSDHALIDVAGLAGIIPLAAMRWARDPNPTERVDYHYVKDVRHAMKVGDLVAVKPTTRARLMKDKFGWEIMNTVPKEGNLFALHQEPIAQAALMSVDPRTGYVHAQVGGYNFEESTFNRAMQACREPGSAFKPIVYSAAIDKLDYTASTLIDDKPIIYDDPDNEVRWKPNNAGEEFRGSLPMRTCLKDSINTPAIRIAEAVGIEDLMKNAGRLGISTPLKRELGTALGSSCTTLQDLVNVYVTLNQYGERQPLRFVRRVVDRYGNVLEDHVASSDPAVSFSARLDGAYEELVSPRERALDKQTAFLTLSLLHNVVTEGTAIGASRLGHWVAGKTGTTNDSYDAWFMGVTRNRVTGVWVGHDKKERPLGVSEQGGRTALPIWTDFTRQVFYDHTVKPPKRRNEGAFPPPAGVVRVNIDPDSGLLARPETARAVPEYYRAGSEPTEFAPDAAVLNPEQVDMWEADAPL